MQISGAKTASGQGTATRRPLQPQQQQKQQHQRQHHHHHHHRRSDSEHSTSSTHRRPVHTRPPPPAPATTAAAAAPAKTAQPAPSTTRPPLGARHNSAPQHVPTTQTLLPHQQTASAHGDKNGHLTQLRHVPGDDSEDDEICQDPFFQRSYTSSHLDPDAHGGDEHSEEDSAESSSDTDGPLFPSVKHTPIPMSAGSASRSPVQTRNRAPSHLSVASRDMALPAAGDFQALEAQDINIGVIGDNGVGKSIFIDRAFGPRNKSNSRTATRKMSIDGTVYTVRLLEIPFDDMDVEQDDRIVWPDKIDDMAAPRIDGALMLYDVMNQESLAHVPGMLNVVHKTALPCVLVGCKCDNHPAHRQVDPAVVEQRAKTLVGDLPAFQSSDGSPDSQRICLSVMLKTILAARQDQPKLTAGARRRANSSALRPVSPRPTWARRHERASSEFSGSRLKMLSEYDAETRAKNAQKRPSGGQQSSFLDLEESPGYESYDSDAADSSDYEPSIISVMPSDENGYTFEQLVDRLLAQPLSKQDTKFVAIFLALYRKFAAPSQLLDAITKRFDALEHERKPTMIRTVAQLRYLSIMEQWLSTYPGDFAHQTTKRKMAQFVTSRLPGNRIFAMAAKEILADLEVVQEDDDTDWACSDRKREERESGEKLKSFLSGTTTFADESEDELSKSASNLSLTLTKDSSEQKDTLGTTERSNSTLTTSTSQTMINNIEQARRQAKLLVPIPRVTLTKTQWHLLMGESEENIARELTRIDWMMFSSIKPRDLVRHVSMNAAEKKKCKNLDNVDRMIEHFNHLAYWVTNFILLRDKPKHRALMLEKFMKVARKLRELNNYNSLGAILAGLNGTAIHRLAATRELITPQTAKDFMKLEILMGTQKSHFAYRLAWENSSGERIPYLPLHRRDLVSAAEGNSTFVTDLAKRASRADTLAALLGGTASTRTPTTPGTPGMPMGVPGLESPPGTASGAPTNLESAKALQIALMKSQGGEKEAPPGGVVGKERINWRKFAIMGEVIVGIQRAQGSPYPNIARNDDIKGMVLDVRICKDDDELYDRSTSLEAIGAAGEPRRRFANWFQR